MRMIRNAVLPAELAVVVKVVGPEFVARYAALTADYNPIHLDPEFAARTAFGRPIVHGTLALNLIIDAVERTFGTVPGNFSLEARFVRPMPVGAKIRAGGTLRDEATGAYDVFVETEAGERAIEGVCTVRPASNDGR
jgi:3-hydroxybutyryl-CoA dehydratase